MDFKSAYQQVKNGPSNNVYLLSGEEEYFIDQLLSTLINRFVDPAMKDFNFTIFYGSEITDQQLLQALSEFPMMADSRVVICHDFDKIKMKNAETLTKYFANPMETTIFIAVAEKIDKRKSLYKKMLDGGFFYEAKKLYDDSVSSWIRQKVQADGYQISLHAAEELFGHIGANLRDIASELEKIYLFLEKDVKEIGVETVDNVCGFSREYSPFQLVNYIVERNFKKALSIGNFLTGKGEPMTKILSGLYFQFNKLWQIEHLLRNNYSDKEVSSRLKIPVFFLKNEKRLASSINSEQYKCIMEVLADTDRRIKSTGIAEKALFNRMVFEIQKCLQ